VSVFEKIDVDVCVCEITCLRLEDVAFRVL
jgi:hypothetical protein